VEGGTPGLLNEASQTPFNRPGLVGRELAYLQEALERAELSSHRSFTQRVERLLETQLGASRVLLTHSCTAALEIAALLTVGPGDEVILPSFAYATTASAFARCGATLVFVDISPDTLNIDPDAVASALTSRTRAIVAVDYAGVACDFDALETVARPAGITLIEDAAQGVGATWRGRPLGTFGALAAFSFHATKNVTSGEGGALIVNDPRLQERAEIIQNRGTNRDQFLRGEVEAYHWLEIGSAFAPSEIVAAFLLAQLEELDQITAARVVLWNRYHEAFAALERNGVVRRPMIPDGAAHNGHIYYLIVADEGCRKDLLTQLHQHGVEAAFHYTPLHRSPAGLKFGHAAPPLTVTDDVAARIVRLPLYGSMATDEQDHVIAAVVRALA
jgi:dTDP-4-amino-4,6-dideoxygalactose transaminase